MLLEPADPTLQRAMSLSEPGILRTEELLALALQQVLLVGRGSRRADVVSDDLGSCRGHSHLAGKLTQVGKDIGAPEVRGSQNKSLYLGLYLTKSGPSHSHRQSCHASLRKDSAGDGQLHVREVEFLYLNALRITRDGTEYCRLRDSYAEGTDRRARR